MSEEEKKVSQNRQKKMDIVTELSEKFGKSKAVVFTNYQGITHKQLEGFKKAIKPLQAEYVVAKNSLLTLALSENKIKLSEEQALDGQTGTLFLYEDVISPLKALAKIIKELNLPSVKFGIMEEGIISGEQVLKLSTLPTKEVLLSQLVGMLQAPISGLHRALNWNLQKLVMTLGAVAKSKPAEKAPEPVAKTTPTLPAEPKQTAPATPSKEPTTEAAPAIPSEETNVEMQASSEPTSDLNEPEPETILSETVEEKVSELPDTDNPTIEAQVKEENPINGTKSPAGGNEKSAEEKNEEQSPEGDNKGGEN